jgi:hypothetical protein
MFVTTDAASADSIQEDLSETTPAVEPLCRALLADPQPQEVQQHIPQIVQVCVCVCPAVD